ncbi:hypothetical protein MLC59_02015 [Marinobacter bryozoorum]|uniref:hypothetical protein n=1 Tax=Marinobacter bryozoorum TaxID=256324 RepID=UPI002002D384|nr:hypothetical protein [Marinobacter bryozoorum]MCK7542945.1 hypothetical protein [Marinobacter bryozoorum]
MTIRPSQALKALEAMFEEADREPVPDDMCRLRVRKAAEDVRSGDRLRQEIDQLSDKSLAGKLECSTMAIRRLVAGGHVEGMAEDDRALVIACRKERASLERRAADLSLPFLTRHYRVAMDDVREEVARQRSGV